MNPRFFLAALAAWGVLAALALVNGALRETVYRPLFGSAGEPLAGSLVLIVLVVTVTWIFLLRAGALYERHHLPLLGTLWLLLTVAFRFAISRLAQGLSWADAPAGFDPFAGRLWVVVLAAIYFAPILVGRLLKPPRIAPRGEELREK